MASNTTLTERTKQRLPRPTTKQMAAAVEIIERANGKSTADARSDALTPFMDAGLVTLHDKLDRARLTEDRLFGTLSNGLDARKSDKADHDIRLKSSKLALELRGLLQRGNRGMTFAPAGPCQVNVGLPWNDNSTVPSNSSIPNDQSNSPSTVRSTIEGTGIGAAAPGPSRSTIKSRAAVPVSEMSASQLKKLSAEIRREEQLRRQKLRAKKNPMVRKHVGPNHRGTKGGCNCKSGKCGKCHECKRRAKLALPKEK